MPRNDEFFAKGLAAIRAGDLHMERPLCDDGPRWGISAVMRPNADAMRELVDVGSEAAALAGAGHWVHGPDALHVTVRAFERHSLRDLTGDPAIARHIELIDETAADCPPLDVTFRGAAPHPGGVVALIDPELGDTPEGVCARMAKAVERRGVPDVEKGFTRDLWHASLLHFAAPVIAPEALAVWSEYHRDRIIVRTRLDVIELVRFRSTGAGVRAETLHSAAMTG